MTLVAERMMRAWAPLTASSSSLGRQAEPDVDLVAGGTEPVEAALGDLFGDEDAGHGRSIRKPGRPRAGAVATEPVAVTR